MEKGKFLGVMQKFGQTLLVPVSILPAAGLLLGFGTSFQSANMIRLLPFLDNPGIKQIMNLMQATGSAIFTNLSLIFAIGVAVGMAKKNDGTAGLAAVAGFLIMNKTISVLMGLDAEIVAANTAMYEIVLGTPTLRTGVFGGIMMGLLAAWGYNRFHTIKLPNYLGFFQAKRFVPIVVSVLSIALGGNNLTCLAADSKWDFRFFRIHAESEYGFKYFSICNYRKRPNPVWFAYSLLYPHFISSLEHMLTRQVR